MKAVVDFTLAAFPWVLCGVAVAIICASMGQRKTKEEEQALEQHMAMGMSLGLALAALLQKKDHS